MASRTDFDVYLKTARGIIKPQSFNGIVYLEQCEDFEIIVVNNSCFKVKSKIYLSGYYIGTLVLMPGMSSPVKKVIEGVDRRFRYCQFNSHEAKVGKLNKESLYSDEITVAFLPQKITLHEKIKKNALHVVADCAVAECDSVDRGGAILGPNKSHQRFTRVENFDTYGKYYFTLIMRTRPTEKLPEIIPLSERYTQKSDV